ncbi:phosphatidate cytidylyltransferase [Acrasis kona]|uniref:Phosphatidate cytidylyltransferase, mitochondrial n=1 Tax=Acrasis kona TaxID=1008807 RepID=A0AAW2Z7C7_9EUKA
MALSSLAPSIGSILKRNLPFDDVRWACAYGSAVFSQKGYKEEDRKKSMVDLIVAVDDPHTFHKKNLQQNPHHYATLMRNLGANSIVSLQNSGAGIYYNTLVPIEDRNWKYGVISTERLVRDLQDWDTMYVAGRLHKPVYIIKDEKAYYPPNLPSIQEAINKNLNSAVIVALLLKAVESNDLDTFSASGNPRVDISIPELYECIAALSYRGDIRFHLRAENKDKVKNIVKANEEGFNKLYEPAIKKLLQENG